MSEGIHIKDAMQKLIEFIEEYTVIFHNAPFDLTFITNALNNLDIELPRNFYSDNLQIAKTYLPNQKSYSLENLAKFLSVPIEVTHRALYDAKITAMVFSKIVEQNGEEINSKNKLHLFLQGKYRIKNFKNPIS